MKTTTVVFLCFILRRWSLYRAAVQPHWLPARQFNKHKCRKCSNKLCPSMKNIYTAFKMNIWKWLQSVKGWWSIPFEARLRRKTWWLIYWYRWKVLMSFQGEYRYWCSYSLKQTSWILDNWFRWQAERHIDISSSPSHVDCFGMKRQLVHWKQIFGTK